MARSIKKYELSMNRPTVETKCKSCGVLSIKRKDAAAAWSGLCRSCSNKEVANRPEIKAKKRHNARAQVLKQGGIPNAGHKNRAGELSPQWKGGLPKCIDCGTQLSLYTCKRCVPCNAKSKMRENHWHWKGGVSDENTRIRQSLEYKLWRKSVFERDKWTCVICGYRSKAKSDIRADHIMPFHLFPSLRLDINNGRTLCIECDKVHGYNYNRDKNKNECMEVSRSIN